MQASTGDACVGDEQLLLLRGNATRFEVGILLAFTAHFAGFAYLFRLLHRRYSLLVQ